MMKTVTFGEKLNSKAVICLGFFDCMHLGHVKLLDTAKRMAKKLDCKVAIFTFDNNHFETLGKSTKLIYTYEERLALYESLGIDYVVHATFDNQFMHNTGKDFVEKIVAMGVCGVVCGFDYTCGGDIIDCNKVKQLCEEHNVEAEIVREVNLKGTKVSSTLVRSFLSELKIDDANKLLTENYYLIGKVVHGRHVGSALGFPTINVNVHSDKLLVSGVYVGYSVIDGVKYNAVINVGGKPTFGVDEINVEAHLIGFNKDMYGKTVKLSFTKFIRPVMRFDNGDQLAEQIRRDVEMAND